MRNWVRRVDERVSSSLRGFGWVGTGFLILVVVVGALVENVYAFLMVAVWLLLSHTRLSDIGLKRPKDLLAVLAGGAIAGIGIKLILKAAVLPLFDAPSFNPMFATLPGNTREFWTWVLRVTLFGGIVEEVIYRGYLLNRLTAAWGNGVLASMGMIVVTALIFGVPHYMDSGRAGAINATIGGVILASIYLWNGRQLLPVMVIHAANDVCSVWLAYTGLDERVSHSIWN
jgi:CAAX protease family protein